MTKNYLQVKRRMRSKKKLEGSRRARLLVSRSNQHIYAQIFDVEKGKVVVGASDLKLNKQAGSKKSGPKLTKIQIAEKVGEDIAKKALKVGIKEVVFDRQGYKYHGRVKAIAEKARENGLKF
ncbi:MAG: 50S ribosomal protein L18 [candidate division WS6 bacterium GW2011_GWA2_37_6]|uniref:Large ribosomal subunit protein uL18 n=1 Tax=candidate division WS6 bacterium GW2011_GWA2_37_6 TaxID=1619087 RepID=A0A0G0H146_9BACT|nr:MAG: 50S ribosomal protein L18 [candidate division WS6 bacterium GW2011_GWA2_37_6]